MPARIRIHVEQLLIDGLAAGTSAAEFTAALHTAIAERLQDISASKDVRVERIVRTVPTVILTETANAAADALVGVVGQNVAFASTEPLNDFATRGNRNQGSNRESRSPASACSNVGISVIDPLKGPG